MLHSLFWPIRGLENVTRRTYRQTFWHYDIYALRAAAVKIDTEVLNICFAWWAKLVSQSCEQKFWKKMRKKLWTKVVNKSFEQKFKNKSCEQKFARCKIELWIRVVTKSYEYKFWAKFAKKGCEEKLTKVNKMLSKFFNKNMNKKLW